MINQCGVTLVFTAFKKFFDAKIALIRSVEQIEGILLNIR